VIQAKANAKAAIDLLRGQTNLAKGAGVYAACDDLSQAQSLIQEARTAHPKNTVIGSMAAPIIAAAVERNKGNFSQAIQLLEAVRPYETGIIIGSSTKYMRGNLYLQQRLSKEAAAEFKAIVDQPGIAILSPLTVLAHLGLARAAAISGDTSAARKSYQDFFALWKDADPDLPVMVQAKKEYEQLK
jgi:eukaryotic-like serine/threonine-protein kinase